MQAAETGMAVLRATSPLTFASGEPPRPVNWTSRGSTTGNWSSGTGTMPWTAQYTTGIGHPQNRWRLTSQSRSR